MEHPRGWNIWGLFHKEGGKDLNWTLEKREEELKEMGIPKWAKATGVSWQEELCREITNVCGMFSKLLG